MSGSKPELVCETLLGLLQLKISVVQMGEELQVQGDFNTKMVKVGDDQHSSWPEVVGNLGLGRANDSG